MTTAVLVGLGLRKSYPTRSAWRRAAGGRVVALDGVDLTLERGQTLGLVGESGSGKTTLGRTMLRLSEPDAGEVRFRGEDLLGLPRRELRRRRRFFQMVFQDPWASLNPRLRIGTALLEPMEVHELVAPGAGPAEVSALLEEVGLDPALATRYPHQLSGGQRQRVGIARALASRPEVLVADEPVSALDVSMRVQVVNLFAELRAARGLAMLWIAHDLTLVQRLADRVAVMYRGRIVEEGPCEVVLAAPRHPYTRALVEAVPTGGRRGRSAVTRSTREAAGAVPPLHGCSYHPHCPFVREDCRGAPPPHREVAPGHRVACFHPGEAARAASESGGTFRSG